MSGQVVSGQTPPTKAGWLTKKGTVPMEKIFALFVAISITTLQFAATVA
jgi:hypothetical protein